MGKLVKVGLKVRAPEGSEVVVKWQDTQFINSQAEGGDRQGVTGVQDAQGFAPILRLNPVDQNDLMQVWSPEAGDPKPRECVIIVYPASVQNSTFATQPWAQRGHPRDTSGDNSGVWDGSLLEGNTGIFDPDDALRNDLTNLITTTTNAKNAALQAVQDVDAAIATIDPRVTTALAPVSNAVQEAEQAAQDARDSADTKTYANDAEREAESPPDGQWSRTLRSTNDGWNYHRREAGVWVLKYEQNYSAASNAPLNMGGVIVPFYHYLADVFNDPQFVKLMNAMREYRRTQFLVVHNPASGPGATADANIQVSMNLIDGAEGKSLGYCDTNYGSRSATDVKADYTQWNALYTSVDGVFLDQVGYALTDTDQASKDAKRAYYKQLISDLYEAGAGYIVANAGSPLLAEWYGDGVFGHAIVIISEGSAMPSVADMAGFGSTHLYWPRNQRAILLHSQSTQPNLSDALDYYGWLGVSDVVNYDTLPSWFGDFCADVEGRAAGAVVPVGPQTGFLRQIQQADDSNSSDLPHYLIERDVPINNYTPAIHAVDLNAGGGYAVGLQYSFTRSTGTLFAAKSLALAYNSFHIEIWGRMTTFLFGTGGAGRTLTIDPLTATLPTSRRRGHDQGGGSLQPGDLFIGIDGHLMIALGGSNGYYQGAKVPFRFANYADISALPSSGTDLLAGSMAYLTTPPIGRSRLVYWNGSAWVHAGSDNWPEVASTVPSNALYIGQIALDVATEKMYIAMATGTANDFKEVGGGSGPLTFATASFNRPLVENDSNGNQKVVQNITCTGILSTDIIIAAVERGNDNYFMSINAFCTTDGQVDVSYFMDDTSIGSASANSSAIVDVVVLR